MVDEMIPAVSARIYQMGVGNRGRGRVSFVSLQDKIEEPEYLERTADK